jgi:hypothetical protein
MSSSHSAPPRLGGEYILRFNGHYAVRILSRGYELVADAEATRFPNPDEARTAANLYSMRVFTIEPAPCR